jgi:hypothetical protein
MLPAPGTGMTKDGRRQGAAAEAGHVVARPRGRPGRGGVAPATVRPGPGPITAAIGSGLLVAGGPRGSAPEGGG